MPVITRQEKFRFWKTWTFQHTWAIPVSYIISLIVILICTAIFGISIEEFGTQLEQLVMQIAAGTVLGLGTGLIQKSLLNKVFNVSAFWIWSVMIGFVLTEALAGYICWRLNINRMEIRFIELNARPESLIFAFAGLLIGSLQWSVLRKHFTGSVYWIFASTIGWGICVITMDYVSILPSLNTLFTDVIAFSAGATLYGAITGAALMWIMQKKEVHIKK